MEYGCVRFVFFFQAEDGIRDGRVTGVQTCALPISGNSFTRTKWAAAETPASSEALSLVWVRTRYESNFCSWDPLIPLTVSKMVMCKIASPREAFGGGVLSARIALSAALFQSVTTSAWAAKAAPSAVRTTELIRA